jgi:putative ABC transport system substrate-binding protein
VKRRTFIAGLGSAAAWPLVARAQQKMPVIGYLSGRSSESDMAMLVAVRRGLEEVGYVEGRNVAIEYRFADGRSDRVPALGMELTARRVDVIVAVGVTANDEPVRFLKASQIPIVMVTGADPVHYGLVSSLNRPGGNLTGFNTFVSELTTKQIEFLHELAPRAKTIAIVVDSGVDNLILQSDARRAAASLGLELLVLSADTDSQIEAAFVAVNQHRPDALIVATNPFFVTRAKQIAALAARSGVPTIYGRREFAAAGGLMSYGFDVADGYRRVGNYAGRILNGEKPADLPFVQPTKFEFIINLKTAKALGLTIPETLLATADGVIE